MKSGLEGRNNVAEALRGLLVADVSMKSGLEGRNNTKVGDWLIDKLDVSMKSGLEGRNNNPATTRHTPASRMSQ